MRFLVTGGCGFIGSHLSEALLVKGDVVILDNLCTGKGERLSDDAEHLNFDISDTEALGNLKNDFDVIFHLAAQISVTRSMEEPELDFMTNVTGTFNILEFAKKNSSKLVYTSSCAVYGDPQELPVKETHPLNPKSVYATNKLLGERLCQEYARTFKLPTIALRLFNVYGPRQQGEYSGVIPVYLEKAMKSDELTIYGDGEQFRDFIYVNDVVDAFTKAAETRCEGEVLNVGTGKTITINELAGKIIKITGSKSKITHKPGRDEEIKGISADMSLAKVVLGFESKTDLGVGLKKTYEWLQEQADD